MTPTQERRLRKVFERGEEYPKKFVQMPLDKDKRTMEALVEYFESEAFLMHQECPPYNFLAVGAMTLSELDKMEEDEDAIVGVLLATACGVWHRDDLGNLIARDEVGYVVGRGALDHEDTYRMWAGNCFRSMGLGSFIEIWSGDEDENMGRYSWRCFDWDGEVGDLAEVMS